MTFEPIAIIGTGCVLPGALSPEALWDALREGRCLLSDPPRGLWGLPAAGLLMNATGRLEDRMASARGGYVTGFEQVFDATGFAITAEQILRLDPLVHWVLHAARQALLSAGLDIEPGSPQMRRTGLVLGHLAFATPRMYQYVREVWRGAAATTWPL